MVLLPSLLDQPGWTWNSTLSSSRRGLRTMKPVSLPFPASDSMNVMLINSQQGRLVHVNHVLASPSLILLVVECSPCPGITMNSTFWSYLGLGVHFFDQIFINLYLYVRVVWLKCIELSLRSIHILTYILTHTKALQLDDI
jgi:hypothetical protein